MKFNIENKTKKNFMLALSVIFSALSVDQVNAQTSQGMNKEIAIETVIIGRMKDSLSRNGGFTFDDNKRIFIGAPADSLYIVSIFPERGEKIEREITKEDLRNFIHKNADVLKNERNSIGGWRDNRGIYYFDISTTFGKNEREQAIAEAKRNNQIAIYSTADGEIRVDNK